MDNDLERPVVASMVMPHRKDRLAAVTARAAFSVLAGKALSLMPPRAIRHVLTAISAGARPATYEEAETALTRVTTLSPSSAGQYGCLQRSLTAALLLRTHGTWATWCVGVPVRPPFRAHAWIEADGKIVSELGTPQSYARLIAVPPRSEGIA